MDPTYFVILSLRKIFGSLLPGFSWVILLYYIFGEQIDRLPRLSFIMGDKVLYYAFLVFLSFLLGSLSLQISFRVLDVAGGLVDRSVARATKTRLNSFFRFLSKRFHIFNLLALEDELKRQFPSASHEEGKEEYGGPYWTCKLYVLENSSSLAREVMESEGDINFRAGMVFPLLVFGIVFLPTSLITGAIAIFLSLFFALRFQHLRHDDIELVANAFRALQDMRKERKTEIE